MVKRLFAVVGHHRGGTSATAGALAHLGIDFGTNLMPASPANPEGYFEDMEVVARHDKLLESMGCSWDCPPPSDVVPTKLAMSASLTTLHLWLSRLGNSANVGVKDPRIICFHKLWQRVARRADREFYAVIVRRSPAAIIDSLAEREGISTCRASVIWEAYEEARRKSWKQIPLVNIGYEQLLSDPEQVLSPIADLIGAPVDNVDRAIDFLDPELNHHG